MNGLLSTVLLATCIALSYGGVDTYHFLDSQNVTVAILRGDISFNLTLNYTGKYKTMLIKVPEAKDVELVAMLYKPTELKQFAPASMLFTAENSTFNLTFGLNGDHSTNSKWDLGYVELVYNHTGPETKLYSAADPALILAENTPNVKSSWGRGFKCTTENFNLASAEFNQSFAYVTINSFQLQPFAFDTPQQLSGSPSLCKHDMADNKIVPIAVGAALGLLVIIVVIAYIIGRFRNRGKKSDYEVISS